MKSFKYISIVLVALLTLVGCKDKMRELNTNSDLVDDTQVIYMFTGATQNFDWQSVRATANYMNSLHKVMGYHVYYSLSATGTAFRNDALDGAVVPSYVDGIAYNELFSNRGNRLQSILTYIDQMTETEQAKYQDIKAICTGLLAYLQWRVVENYGATVYSQAFKAIDEGITQPEYEYIENIYKDIDGQYADAISILAGEPNENEIELGTSDFFAGYVTTPDETSEYMGTSFSSQGDYDAQRAAWLRFFNMSRLEMAWKLSGRDASLFSSVFSACQSIAQADPANIMSSIDDGFFFNFAHDLCCEDDMQEPESLHVCADGFINFLIANKDPRLPYLARINGATEETSITFNMMKQYFQDSLDKYPYLDGKHPYIGLTTNPGFGETPMEKKIAGDPNTFITSRSKSFTKMQNPMPGNAEFKFTDKNGEVFTFCEKDVETFDASILLASMTQYRYWVLCGARHAADHAYSGNGIAGLGNAQLYYKYHSDGDSNDEGGQYGVATRCRIFTYAKQCFMLAAIGQTFAGKSPQEWYEEGVQAAFDEICSEVIRCRIQAYNGGDEYGTTSHKYPSQLTQANFDGSETVFTYPYVISQDMIDTYLAAHPYSAENLYDQIYVYGFLDPYTSYTWSKILATDGLTFKLFKHHATPEDAQQETHVYIEKPYADKQMSTELLWPRRGCLPNRGTLNANWYDARTHLLAVEGFGSEWEKTQNKIWWDVK